MGLVLIKMLLHLRQFNRLPLKNILFYRIKVLIQPFLSQFVGKGFNLKNHKDTFVLSI